MAEAIAAAGSCEKAACDDDCCPTCGRPLHHPIRASNYVARQSGCTDCDESCDAESGRPCGRPCGRAWRGVAIRATTAGAIRAAIRATAVPAVVPGIMGRSVVYLRCWNAAVGGALTAANAIGAISTPIRPIARIRATATAISRAAAAPVAALAAADATTAPSIRTTILIRTAIAMKAADAKPAAVRPIMVACRSIPTKTGRWRTRTSFRIESSIRPRNPPASRTRPRGRRTVRTGKGITIALRKGTVPFSSNENWDSPPLIDSPALTCCEPPSFFRRPATVVPPQSGVGSW